MLPITKDGSMPYSWFHTITTVVSPASGILVGHKCNRGILEFIPWDFIAPAAVQNTRTHTCTWNRWDKSDCGNHVRLET